MLGCLCGYKYIHGHACKDVSPWQDALFKNILMWLCCCVNSCILIDVFISSGFNGLFLFQFRHQHCGVSTASQDILDKSFFFNTNGFVIIYFLIAPHVSMDFPFSFGSKCFGTCCKQLLALIPWARQLSSWCLGISQLGLKLTFTTYSYLNCPPRDFGIVVWSNHSELSEQ